MSSGNKKINDLFIPVKKNRPNATTTTTTTLDDRKPPDTETFITPKRRRRLEPGKHEELDKLFDKISDDPFYENIIPSISNYTNDNGDSIMADQDLVNNPPSVTADQQIEWLYDNNIHGLSSTPTADDLAKMADEFLEEELTEQLKQALNSTDLHDDGIADYHFFSEHCKLPDPLLHHENMEMADKSTKMKYYHIIKYSRRDEERHFLLSSGQFPLWHRLGWQCPHSVLQWLIEIVAFDKNIEMARLAMSTVSSLWLDMLSSKPLESFTTDGINYDQKFSLDTFSYIMTSYGALNLPVTTTTTAMTTDPKDDDDTMMTEKETPDRIPLTQFEWVLDLLKTSLTLWPNFYTVSQLHYLANTLICLGMDRIGALVLKHIQDALDACLDAFPDDDWKTQVRQLASTLCEQQFTSTGLQARLPTTAKPTCDRSLYLRRTIALLALELALERNQQQSTNRVAPSLSQGQSLSLFLVSDEILPRLATIVNDRCSIFRQTEPHYRDYSDQICLLDYAIGNNYSEFMTCIDAIHSLVTQLQASSRKIGGRLGTLERTKANEVTQRLWSRLAYVIGRNGNTVEDIEF